MNKTNCPKCNEKLLLETLAAGDKNPVHEHLYCPNEHGYYCLTQKIGTGALNFS